MSSCALRCIEQVQRRHHHAHADAAARRCRARTSARTPPEPPLRSSLKQRRSVSRLCIAMHFHRPSTPFNGTSIQVSRKNVNAQRLQSLGRTHRQLGLELHANLYMTAHQDRSPSVKVNSQRSQAQGRTHRERPRKLLLGGAAHRRFGLLWPRYFSFVVRRRRILLGHPAPHARDVAGRERPPPAPPAPRP